MATTIPQNPTTQTVNLLLQKLNDTDPDFRFMSLNDLLQVLDICKPDLLHHDYNTAARTVDHLVRALDDNNGEVQNLAIKCLGPLVRKLPSQIMGPLMEKLSTLKLKNSVDNTVPALALKNVIEALPRPVPGVAPGKDVAEAYAGISRVLIPRLLGRSIQASKATGGAQNVRLPAFAEGLFDTNFEVNAETVDVLIEVVRCFGPMLQPVEVEALQDAVVSLLEKDKGTSVVKKRAVVATSILAVYLSDDLLPSFVERSVNFLSSPKANSVTRRLYITVLGSMARSIPMRFGQHLEAVVPLVLAALSEDELQAQLEALEDDSDMGDFNEVREAALVALEALLASCPNQMRPYTETSLAAILRYLKYDPNYAADDDEEMDEDEEEEEDDEFDGDDDFDMDEGFDDDDDASWKVRRCAAKAMHTLISTRSSGDLLDNGVLYDQAAPALIKRFAEREENVRLEVISAMSLLVRKTGEGVIADVRSETAQSENQPPASRKRRRQSSGGGATSFLAITSASSGSSRTSPRHKRARSGPQIALAEKTPSIIKAATKLLKGKLIPTKQAIIGLLDDIVAVQDGGLAEYFDQVLGPIIEAIKLSTASGAATGLSATGGNASATLGTLRITALRLTSRIAHHHESESLQPYLSNIVAGVLSAVKDRFYKISGEAVQTAEELISLITSSEAQANAAANKGDLQKLYDVVVDRTIATDVDAEVRQKAIQALGTLLSRTSTAQTVGMLSADQRREALGYLLERLKNETTRIASVRAIDDIAKKASSNVQFDPEWARQVAVELSAQLRKANRALRGASAQALRHLVHSPASAGCLDDKTVQSLVTALQPVITNNDAHLLSPALCVLADLVGVHPKLVVTPQIILALCQVLQSPVAGSVLEPLLELVTNIGQNGAGQPLMAGLLKDVGISGDPAVVGKVIGNLLVASGGSAGVTIDSFMGEVKNSQGDQLRASLALAVLGEVGLRLGDKSPIAPELFLEQFSNDLDKVALSAAVALGRAGAGNVSRYLPVILENMKTDSRTQYLLLHSVKETLQQGTISDAYIAPVWEQLLLSAGAEDNKAVCAECLGRVVIISPQAYIPKLEALLSNKDPSIKGIAVQAIRYSLPEASKAFDDVLEQHLVTMLNIMLSDRDMEIRRLAMTALNSAAHNKPELIVGHLGQLVPYVMEESKIKEELIREVQMGPFKHVVDDGLELRKGAYETLYALMETAFSRISIIDLYDRIVAGLGDVNDIRALCNLMVSKLVIIAPEETTRRLDSIADKFRATLSTKLKDNAVKQDHEKQDEANKSVLRVTLLLSEQLKGSSNAAGAASDIGANQRWAQYCEWVKKDFDRQLKVLREENMELGGRAMV